MARKTQYEQLADQVSLRLHECSKRRVSWLKAMVSARALTRVLGMCPQIRDEEGNTISERSDGDLQLRLVGGEEICVEGEEAMEVVLAQRGLTGRLWH